MGHGEEGSAVTAEVVEVVEVVEVIKGLQRDYVDHLDILDNLDHLGCVTRTVGGARAGSVAFHLRVSPRVAHRTIASSS